MKDFCGLAEGVDLGIHDGNQYAIVPSGNVYRRPATHAGTYGGWRWESDATHLLRYPTLWPSLADALREIAAS